MTYKLKNGKTAEQMTIFHAPKTNTIYYGVVDGYVYKWNIEGEVKMGNDSGYDLILDKKIDRSGNLY